MIYISQALSLTLGGDLLLPHFAEALPQCSTSLGLCHKKGSMYSRTLQEEHDFQAGITVSLGLPEAVSITPPASSSHHSLSTPITRASSSAMTTPNHLHTLPYHPPNITHHMNSDWMRPFEDVGQRKHPSVVSGTPIRGFD